MKNLFIFVFLLIGIESFSQANIIEGITDSIPRIQQIEFPMEQAKLLNNYSPVWTPDTIIIKAEVIKIKRKKHGYLVDIFDVNQDNYYKIVTWRSRPVQGNRIKINRVYSFRLWAAAPSQIGDITFKQEIIKKGDKKIRVNYRTTKGLILSTFYFTSNLEGLTYYSPE